MGRIIWYPDAKRERTLLIAYSFQHFGRKTALRLQKELNNNSALLLHNPNMGSIEHGLDYLPVTVRYLVIEGIYKEYYYVKNDEVRILRLWHCAQEPEKLDDYFKNNPWVVNEPLVEYGTKKKQTADEA